MEKGIKLILSLLLLFSFIQTIINCNPAKAEKPVEKTQLEIREYQTRIYDTKDTKMVMKAVINALQDDGYIIENINNDLGIVTATKEKNIKSTSIIPKNFFRTGFTILFMGGLANSYIESAYSSNLKINGTVNISEYNNKIKVRLGFVQKLQETQELTNTRPIYDPEFYNNFFAKLDKGIFIQKENI